MPGADHFPELQWQTGWSRVLQRFRDWVKPQAGWVTLDVGCGPGLLPALLAQAGCCSLGVDRYLDVFYPTPLHTRVLVADVFHLPFPAECFDLITASNLLFLLPDPQAALQQMTRCVRPGGQIVTLNPSEHLSVEAATTLADERSLTGSNRKTLINWAARAETHFRWDEAQTAQLFIAVGLELIETHITMGPGLARFARGMLVNCG